MSPSEDLLDLGVDYYIGCQNLVSSQEIVWDRDEISLHYQTFPHEPFLYSSLHLWVHEWASEEETAADMETWLIPCRHDRRYKEWSFSHKVILQHLFYMLARWLSVLLTIKSQCGSLETKEFLWTSWAGTVHPLCLVHHTLLLVYLWNVSSVLRSASCVSMITNGSGGTAQWHLQWEAQSMLLLATSPAS